MEENKNEPDIHAIRKILEDALETLPKDKFDKNNLSTRIEELNQEGAERITKQLTKDLSFINYQILDLTYGVTGYSWKSREAAEILRIDYTTLERRKNVFLRRIGHHLPEYLS